jgi:hypothetical protein
MRTVNLSEDEPDDEVIAVTTQVPQKRKRARKKASKSEGGSLEAAGSVTNGKISLPQSTAMHGKQLPDHGSDGNAVSVNEQPVLPRALLASVKARRSLRAKPKDSDGGATTTTLATGTRRTAPAVNEADGRFARELNQYMATRYEAERHILAPDETYENTGLQSKQHMPVEGAFEQPLAFQAAGERQTMVEEATEQPSTVELAQEEAVVEKPKKTKKRKSGAVADANVGQKAGLEHDLQLRENFPQQTLAETEDQVAPDLLDAAEPDSQTVTVPAAQKKKKRKRERKPEGSGKTKGETVASEQASNSQVMALPDEMADMEAPGEDQADTEAQIPAQVEEDTSTQKKRKRKKRPSAVAEDATQSGHVQAEELPPATKKREKTRKSKDAVPESAVELPKMTPAETIDSRRIEAEDIQHEGFELDALEADAAELDDIEPDAIFEPEIAESEAVELENNEVGAPALDSREPEILQDTAEDLTSLPLENVDEVEPTESPPPPKKKKRKSRASRAEPVEEPTEIDISPVKKSKKKRNSRASRADDAGEPTEADISPAKKSRKKHDSSKHDSSKQAETDDADETDDFPERRATVRMTRNIGRAYPRTGAEIEMHTEHQLRRPLDLRDGGAFSEDEAELLRRHIKGYMHNNDLSLGDLVALIQWTRPHRGPVSEGGADPAVEAQKYSFSRNFWTDVYDVLPLRKNVARQGTTHIQRFVRRRWHNLKGQGGWDEAEDEALCQLVALYPKEWKKIGQIMGDRNEMACRDRWRNYLQYGLDRRTYTWGDEEIDALLRAIAEVHQSLNESRIKEGKPPLEEIKSHDINWQVVSDKVGTRSRLQCHHKYRTLQIGGDVPKSAMEHHKAMERRHLEYWERVRSASGARDKKRTKKSTHTYQPKLKDMLWGDKLELILALSQCDFDAYDDIDFRQVAEKMDGDVRWRRKDLKAAFKQLCEATLEKLGEDEAQNLDLTGTIDAITTYLSEEHADELEDRYVPPAENVDAPAMQRTPSPAAVKRKKESEAKKAQRRRKRQRAAEGVEWPTKKLKSSEFVTLSDDEL